MQTKEARGVSSADGFLHTAVVRPADLARVAAHAVRRWKRRQFWSYGWRELPLRLFLRFLPTAKRLIPGLNVQHGALYAQVVRNLPEVPLDWEYVGYSPKERGLVYHAPEFGYIDVSLTSVACRDAGTYVEDLGLVGRHLVVTAGKTYLASSLANSVEPENLKFHGFGTGTTAAAAGDTALQTELTTQYATDNTRPTGSQSTSTNTYTTVGTLSPDASVAITEWGLFSASSAGTLLDRQVFTAINLTNVDSLQVTYVFTQS